MLQYNNLYDPNWSYFRFKRDFKNIYTYLLKIIKKQSKREISIVFVDNATSKKLNKKYRFKNKATDVISFNFDKGKEKVKIKSQLLGEIIISVDKVKAQAKEYNHSQRREMCFLYLHGLLHILGYNHKTKREREIMFGLQNQVLAKLNITR